MSKHFIKKDIIRIDGFGNVGNNFADGIVIETDGFTTDWTELDDYYRESLRELNKKGEAAFGFYEMPGTDYKSSQEAELGHKRIVDYIRKNGWHKFKYNSPKFVKNIINAN